MALIVQKYGGTSVGSAERIKRVAERIARRAEVGDRVVAVVSAMGKTTDELISLASQVSSEPHPREMDVLLSTGEIVSSTLLTMALHDLGRDAVSLTGRRPASAPTPSTAAHASLASTPSASSARSARPALSSSRASRACRRIST